MPRTQGRGGLPAAEILLATLARHTIVSITDAAGRILHVNEPFCAISGYSAAELLG